MNPVRYTKLGRMTTLPITDVHFGQKPGHMVQSFLQNLLPSPEGLRNNPTVESMRQGIEDLAIVASRARKSADPDVPLSFIDKVREFIHFNAPKVDLGEISEMLGRAKLPLLAVLGVTAAAGIAYLAYKAYHNRGNIGAIVSKLMDDIKATAPDVMKVPGWFESVRTHISDAVNSLADSPAKLINKLAKIKEEMINHQSQIAPAGSGINLCAKRHSGKGIRSPI